MGLVARWMRGTGGTKVIVANVDIWCGCVIGMVCYLVETADCLNGGTGDFSNISLAQVSSTDKLDEYLRQPNKSVMDPLKWWKESKTKYPNLHCMVLDYLSVPSEYPFPSILQQSMKNGFWSSNFDCS